MSIKEHLICCPYGKKKPIKSQGAGYGHGAVSYRRFNLYVICGHHTGSSVSALLLSGDAFCPYANFDVLRIGGLK
jgi:hypothetical protein